LNIFSSAHRVRSSAVGSGTALQAVRSWVRFFIEITLVAALWPWGRLSFSHKWVPGIFPVHRADNLTTSMSPLSWNLGASTSWNPQCLPSPVQGLLCLYPTFPGVVEIGVKVSVARKWQLASRQCLLQISYQPAISWGVQTDGNHRAPQYQWNTWLVTVLPLGTNGPPSLHSPPRAKWFLSPQISPVRKTWLVKNWRQMPTQSKLPIPG